MSERIFNFSYPLLNNLFISEDSIMTGENLSSSQSHPIIDILLFNVYYLHMPAKKIYLLPLLLISCLALFSLGGSGRSSEKKPEKISVPEILPLKLRYKVGETLYYRLVRQNYNFKLDGTKSGEMRAVTYFTRTRLDDDSQGRVNEKFVWKSFFMGQSMTPSPLKMSEFKEAENFTLLYSVNDAKAIQKLDFSSLPRTLSGFFFMILAWDAVTFDGATRPTQYLSIPEEAKIGTEFIDTQGPDDLVFSFPPLVTDSKYTFSGKNWVKLTGASLVKKIPCAIIEFANLENRVEINLHLKPMEIKTQGFEHFWGKTYLSLEDGRIVRGELVGPVALIQEIKMPGQEKAEHSELLAVGYLEMDLLSEEEFHSELRKTKENQ